MRVLFVCLGNICRSPTAEGVARHLALASGEGEAWQFDSAGTADYHVGNAPDLRSQAAARRRGVDLADLRARQVSGGDFRAFDLILAMDRQNLSTLRRLQPASGTAHLGLIMEYAPQPGLLEIPDPYYGSEADFEIVLDLCFAACNGLLARAGAR